MFVIIASVFCLVPRAASSTDLLLLLPGFPGTSVQAQPYVDRMLRHLEQELALPEGSMHGMYIPDGSLADQELENVKPGIALVGPSVYARHAKTMKMKVIAKVTANGRGEQQYHVVVGRSGPDALDKLEGRVSGSVVYDASYVTKVLFDGKVQDSKLTFQNNTRPLRALRDLSKGKVNAVIVDDETLRYMADLPYASELKKIYSSKPVPAPAVVVMNEGKKFAPKLKKVLVGLCGREEGKALCQALTIDSISAATDGDYSALLKKYRR